MDANKRVFGDMLTRNQIKARREIGRNEGGSTTIAQADLDALCDMAELALERAGAKVRDTSHFGAGFPDQLVAWRKTIFLVEVKNPEYASQEQAADPDHVGMLTESQLKMRKAWPIIVALSAAEAIRKMDALIAQRPE